MNNNRRQCKSNCPYASKMSLNGQQLLMLDLSKSRCSNAHCPFKRKLQLRRKLFMKNNIIDSNIIIDGGKDGETKVILNKTKSRKYTMNDFEILCNDIKSNDINKQFRGVVAIRNAVCDPNPPIQELIDCGVVPPLIKLLSCENNHHMQKEAAWALTNMVSGKEEHTEVVINNGAIPIFVKLLSSPKLSVADQAVWALGNISGDTLRSRNLVLEAGGMKELLLLFDKYTEISFLRNLVWAVSNLCRFKPRPFKILEPALPILAKLLNHTDEQVLADVCWCFSYLSDDDSDQGPFIKAVIASGVCKRLVQLMKHKSMNIQTTALRSVGNIVTGDYQDTQAILNHKPLPALLKLLKHENDSIRKEAAWTISNITAGPSHHIQEVINANIIEAMVPFASTPPLDLQTEAIYCICNATAMATQKQAEDLVKRGVLSPLVNILEYGFENSGYCPVLCIAMNGLDNIFYKGQIQNHHHNKKLICGCDTQVYRLLSHHHDPMHHCIVNKFAKAALELDALKKLELLCCHTHYQIRTLALKITQSYCFMSCAEYTKRFELMRNGKNEKLSSSKGTLNLNDTNRNAMNRRRKETVVSSSSVNWPTKEEKNLHDKKMHKSSVLNNENKTTTSSSSSSSKSITVELNNNNKQVINNNNNEKKQRKVAKKNKNNNESNKEKEIREELLKLYPSCGWNKCKQHTSRVIILNQKHCQIKCTLDCQVRYHYPSCWNELLTAKEYHARKRSKLDGVKLKVGVPCFSPNCAGFIEHISVKIDEKIQEYLVPPKIESTKKEEKGEEEEEESLNNNNNNNNNTINNKKKNKKSNMTNNNSSKSVPNSPNIIKTKKKIIPKSPDIKMNDKKMIDSKILNNNDIQNEQATRYLSIPVKLFKDFDELRENCHGTIVTFIRKNNNEKYAIVEYETILKAKFKYKELMNANIKTNYAHINNSKLSSQKKINILTNQSTSPQLLSTLSNQWTSNNDNNNDNDNNNNNNMTTIPQNTKDLLTTQSETLIGTLFNSTTTTSNWIRNNESTNEISPPNLNPPLNINDGWISPPNNTTTILENRNKRTRPTVLFGDDNWNNNGPSYLGLTDFQDMEPWTPSVPIGVATLNDDEKNQHHNQKLQQSNGQTLHTSNINSIEDDGAYINTWPRSFQ